MWNPDSNNKGVCKCETKCRIRSKIGGGKYSNGIMGNCVNITAIIFEKGTASITGAKTIKQVDELYSFLISAIQENYCDIVVSSVLE